MRRLVLMLATIILLCTFMSAEQAKEESKTDDLQIIEDTWTFEQGAPESVFGMAQTKDDLAVSKRHIPKTAIEHTCPRFIGYFFSRIDRVKVNPTSSRAGDCGRRARRDMCIFQRYTRQH